MTGLRRNGWKIVRQAREHLTLCLRDPRRTSARNPAQGYKVVGYMNGIVRQSERVSNQMRTTFKGLLPSESIEEYIATRLGPFKDELDDINEKAKALNSKLQTPKTK